MPVLAVLHYAGFYTKASPRMTLKLMTLKPMALAQMTLNPIILTPMTLNPMTLNLMTLITTTSKCLSSLKLRTQYRRTFLTPLVIA